MGKNQGRHRVAKPRRQVISRKYLTRTAAPLSLAAAVLLLSSRSAEAATILTISPLPGMLEQTVCQSNLCSPVAFSPLPEWNVANLDYAIQSASGPVAVVAYSQASIAAEQWLRQHASDPDRSTSDRIAFVLIGNPSRPYGGNPALSVQLPPLPYQVIDVVREYDIVADAPGDPNNLLAMANAMAGFLFVHLDTAVDINDPANIVWKVGNTTYVIVPTKNLPLLEPLRAIGLTALADVLNAPLKAIVDQAYDRTIPAAAAAVKPSAPTETAPDAAPTSIASGLSRAPESATVSVDLTDEIEPAASDGAEPSDRPTTAGPANADDGLGDPGPAVDEAASSTASGPDVVTSGSDPVTADGRRGTDAPGVARVGVADPADETVAPRPQPGTAEKSSDSSESETKSARSAGTGSAESAGGGTGTSAT